MEYHAKEVAAVKAAHEKEKGAQQTIDDHVKQLQDHFTKLKEANWINLNDDDLREYRTSIMKQVLTAYIRKLVGKTLSKVRKNEVGVPGSKLFVEGNTCVTIVLDEIGSCLPLLHAMCRLGRDARAPCGPAQHYQQRKKKNYLRIIAVGTGGYDNRLAKSQVPTSKAASPFCWEVPTCRGMWCGMSSQKPPTLSLSTGLLLFPEFKSW